MSVCSSIRSRRHRRLTTNDANDEDGEEEFRYQEGDLTTVETVEGLDLEFRVHVLSNLLICPLCHGFFRDAMTIKECLHTFCRSCLALQISRGLHACPVCHSRIATHVDDSVQCDLTIQNLVDKLFPQFAKEEEIEKNQLYESIGLIESTTSMLHGSIPSSHLSRQSKSLTVTQCCGWEATDEWLRKIAVPGQFGILEHHPIQVSLHPEESVVRGSPLEKFELQLPFIRTTPKIHVRSLAAHVASKLGLKKHAMFHEGEMAQVELLIDGQVLGHSHTLEFVCRSRRLDIRRCVPIAYRLLSTLPPSTPEGLQQLGVFTSGETKGFSEAGEV